MACNPSSFRQQIPGGWVDPVDIFDRQDDRPIRAQRCERAKHGAKSLFSDGLGVVIGEPLISSQRTQQIRECFNRFRVANAVSFQGGCHSGSRRPS